MWKSEASPHSMTDNSTSVSKMTYVTKPIPTDKPNPDHVVRPWGQFKQYAFNEDCTVSLMEVRPGIRLSLQSHTGRAELWIVMDEGAQV